MENAVDALKIAFAVFVFVIALGLTFSIVGQARATSDIIIKLKDKTSLYEYVDSSENNAEDEDRIVGFETILPTIYRYSKEQYAVTILDKEYNPIVRYDLYTEGFMSDWDEILKNENESSGTSQFTNAKNQIKLVDEFIYQKTEEQNVIWGGLVTGSPSNYKSGNLYNATSTVNSKTTTAAPWVGNDEEIIKRIRADLNGDRYKKNQITYQGKNLNQYKDREFKEYFIEIQTSGTTITELDEDQNVEYSLETVKGNKKLEIIYILQPEK